MVFTIADQQSRQGINEALNNFYSISSLKMSYNKSEFCCCSVSSIARQIWELLGGFKLGTLPVRFLGGPLLSGKLRDADCRL